MITDASKRAFNIGRLLARWEVSRFAVLPTSFTLMSMLPVWLGLCGLSKVTDRIGFLIGLVAVAIWLVVVALEHGRAVWNLRHPYASQSWLRDLRAAVGDRVVDEALARLSVQHAFAPGYVIRRHDVAVAIWVERDTYREANRQAEGLRLDEALHRS